MRDFSFEKNSSTFMDKLIGNLRYKKVFRFLKENNVDLEGKIVCDIGCGYNANLLTYLDSHFHCSSLLGVDLSYSGKCQNIKFISANIEVDTLDIEDSSIDVLFSLAVIEHLNDPKKYLSEIKRILKHDGVLIMTTPSLYGKPVLEILAYTGIGTKEEILDHKIYYTRKSLKQALSPYFGNIVIQYFQFGLNIILIVKNIYDKEKN